MNSFQPQRGRMFAYLLILAGAILFLDNLGILALGDISRYWPAWLIFWGVVLLDRNRNAVAMIWAFAFIASGVLLILGNLRILPVTGSVFWPVMLIAFGATMLLRPFRPEMWAERLRVAAAKGRNRPGARPHCDEPRGTYYGNRLQESAVFSSVNRRLETQQFEGGRLESVFGSIQLDLSGVGVTSGDRIVMLEAKAVFGGIELIVPRSWKVVLRTKPVFGGCSDHTVPPRPEPGVEPVTLVVTGEAVFGGIQIRN